MLISADEARRLAEASLAVRGVGPANAQVQADLLIESELRGLPSYGLQRLPRLVARLEAGLADPAASGEIRSAHGGVCTIDGQRGLGPVVMMRALQDLSRVVRRQGVALAAVHNANHIGMLAYYAEAATARGLIGIVLTTSEALVHPFGGTRAMLGTNPIAIGIPTENAPFLLDLATSLVSMGKIHHHALIGMPIPEGWAVDAEGRATTDPEAGKGGAIAPFGEAKGYGLGLAVELLVAMLAGSAFAPEVRGTLDATEVANKGNILILIDPTAGEGCAAALSAYLGRLRGSRPADPSRPVAVPGDGMRARRAKALREGFELPDALHEEIRSLSEG